jgi:hypothetical protein
MKEIYQIIVTQPQTRAVGFFIEATTYGALANISCIAEITPPFWSAKHRLNYPKGRGKFAYISYVVPKYRDSITYMLTYARKSEDFG